MLKPNGKIILFWPPEFGLSVLFFKAIWFVFKNIFKKDVKLHPDEVPRVKSKKHLKTILGHANFSTVEYYFGFRDFFTYVVIVVEKM